MKVGSLFAGIGGLELGLERAGMEVVWQVEVDDWCRRVLARHFPDAVRYGDVRECWGAYVAFTHAERRRRRQDNEGAAPPERDRSASCGLAPVDLICGGFPCQPVSHAGKRQGDKDERWLWPEFRRIVCEVRPRWVVVENVPGLLSINSGRLFGGILADLAALGFDVEWDCIGAADLGAPHLRKRVFILAQSIGAGGGSADRDAVHEGRPACEGGREGVSASAGRQDGATKPDDRPAGALPDTEGQPRTLRPAAAQRQGRPTGGRAANADGQSPFWTPISRGQCDQWTVEPDVRGVVDGISERLERDIDARSRMGTEGYTREGDEGLMRTLWDDVATVAASRGWRQDEQLANELANLLCLLPHETSLGTREAALEAVGYVRGMRAACASAGLLRDAQQPLQEAWQSASEEDQGWLDMAARGGHWVSEWPGVPRVAHGITGRVNRLRGLGNAVVPQVAEYIGRLIMNEEVIG